jgi:HSP20 family molecular chaperone IbpA
MNALMPRFFGDMTDWFELEFPLRAGHMIRVEDLMTEHEYVLRAELPGMDPEKDVQVSIANGILTVHAERKEETQARHRSEFRYGMLQRSVRLPANADEKHVTAKYGKGILEVAVPLTAIEPTAKQIAIAKAE